MGGAILVTMPAGEMRDSFFIPGVARKAEKLGDLVWNPAPEDYSPRMLAAALEGIEVCITGWGTPFFTPEILGGASALRLIAHTGGTVAPVVSAAVFEKGIRVLSANPIFAQSVAEGTLAYMLSGLRQIPQYARRMRMGGWREENDSSQGLFGKTVGLVGFGAIPRYLVRLLEPFGVRPLAWDKYVPKAEIQAHGARSAQPEEIFAQADIISIHLPATPETHGMIGKKLLDSIRPGALLVNTARGAVVDERALETTLREKRFWAVLDVFEREPLPKDSPLRRMENVTLIPHMGGPTLDQRPRAAEYIVDLVDRFLGGDTDLPFISAQQARRMTRPNAEDQ
ncbi:hydroxyacid dehydrogenase [Ruminococcaceae bacterium OttesenSCG-928-D13]|nr:hydroxyacid dehydrogenase [Ruminococcaceae bacterium OttesenSCG-928-D13]